MLQAWIVFLEVRELGLRWILVTKFNLETVELQIHTSRLAVSRELCLSLGPELS